MEDNNSAEIIEQLISANRNNLSPLQMKNLEETLKATLAKYQIDKDKDKTEIIDIQIDNARVLKEFISAKQIEGRSDTTLYNYAKEVSKLFLALNKSYRYITSKDIREYMAWRKSTKDLTSVSVANIRMYLMSFFKWCFKEEYINKNPMDKIGVIKTETHVIEILTDEEQEIIRCACTCERDLAIIDLLSGSGMRVSELSGLNFGDLNLRNNEIRVFGKGAKERIVLVTDRAKSYLERYIETARPLIAKGYGLPPENEDSPVFINGHLIMLFLSCRLV